MPKTRHQGKVVGTDIYIHVSAMGLLQEEQQDQIKLAADIAGLVINENFNVARLSTKDDSHSLLSYPDFFENPFPSLARSWRITLSRKTIVYRNYLESRNPPILHRKELLLAPDNPFVKDYSQLTEVAETLGLFDEPNKIGFREHWFQLIKEHGYELVGSEFVPIANLKDTTSENHFGNNNAVQRHLTALSRYNFSAPVQALSRHGLITQNRTFFDYGCGRGDDVRGLVANGINATGWDPHFSSDSEKRIADVVNIGFVINVIEDIDERVGALRGAYEHTRGVLSVAAMLTSNAIPEGRRFRDGYMTSRNTFQKYFTQGQLRDFIEHTVDDVAIAAGPGVFFIFRDKDLEQQFLSKRYGHRAPTILSRGWVQDRPSRNRAPRIDRATKLFEEYREIYDALWQLMLELGRAPDINELTNDISLENIGGSLNRAVRLVHSRFDQQELDRSRHARISDIVVFLAMQQFEKRKPYKHLEPRLQRDIRAFFGDYSTARDSAKSALYSLGITAAINAACLDAFERGLGHLEESQSLQLHVSLIERLPTPLRIYIGCATVLCGDISEFDLVKIHIRSGKVSLLKYEKFEESPLPRLIHRVKVSLKEQELDIFDYGPQFPPTLLYQKSLYINEEFPRYPEQVAFELALAELKIADLSGYGPSEADFLRALGARRWRIDGFNLLRSDTLPKLDDPCGANFTYRQLIKCGETQTRTKIPNIPLEPDTYTALLELAINILDPIIEYYGMVKLTYGFCSSTLAREIPGRIAPKLDQHASHEKNKNRNFICERLGAAVDFLVEHEDMFEVANWLTTHLAFDRLYYYGNKKPIHVSVGPEMKGEFIALAITSTGRRVPRKRQSLPCTR